MEQLDNRIVKVLKHKHELEEEAVTRNRNASLTKKQLTEKEEELEKWKDKYLNLEKEYIC